MRHLERYHQLVKLSYAVKRIGECASLLVLLSATVSCSSEGLASGEQLGVYQDGVMNGEVDTTHDAVVAWLHDGKCSGTIIHVNNNTGYALTAAHCVSNSLGKLRQGDSHANNQFDVEYTVIDAVPHPEYSKSSAYDFAMLKFTGASASTPTIDPLTPADDNMTKGKTVDVVGYGNTENGGTKIRHHKELTINYLTELRINIDQQSGGMCFGDSGGATLYTTEGEERLAGVNSGVSDDSCLGFGTSARVSAVYETFIQPYINNTPFQEQSCAQCTDAHIYGGICVGQLDTCWNDADCSDYIACINGCFSAACVVACKVSHPSGLALYEKISECVCGTACSSECAQASKCAAEPACGLSDSKHACQSCYEQNCCDEAAACANDPQCDSCYDSVAPNAGCFGNEPLEQLNACLSSNCADACNVPPSEEEGAGGESGAGVGASSGAGGGAPAEESNGQSASSGGMRIVSSCAFADGRGSSRTGWAALLLSLVLLRRRRA